MNIDNFAGEPPKLGGVFGVVGMQDIVSAQSLQIIIFIDHDRFMAMVEIL